MENKNSVTKTNIVYNSSESSTIYLKKSELPKNVSSFKNDAGYVSKEWLKKSPYITKDEVKSLIDQSSTAVIDGINRTYSDEALNEIKEKFNQRDAEIKEIKDHMKDFDKKYVSVSSSSSFLKKSDISGLASKEWVSSQGYAEKSEIPDTGNMASKEWVRSQGYIKSDSIPSLEGLASEKWVKNQGYAKKSEIPSTDGLATQEWVNEKGYITAIDIPSLEGLASEKWVKNQGYAKKSEIPSVSGLASKEWVSSQGYITKSEIPSIDGLATQEWVKSQKYVSQSKLDGTLGNYAKKSSVYDKNYIDRTFLTGSDIYETFMKADDIRKTYLPKNEIESVYITKREVSSEYLRKEDYRGLKAAATVSEAYRDKTVYDIIEDLKTMSLMDGFYITNDMYGGECIAIIKENDIIMVDNRNGINWIEQ